MATYLKLAAGIGMATGFIWILIKNRKRSGIMHAMLRLDTLIIVVVGVFLIVSALKILF